MSKRRIGARARTNKGKWKDALRAIRRKLAEARQLVYNKLSIAEKIKKLDNNNWTATKERAKLQKQLEKTNVT